MHSGRSLRFGSGSLVLVIGLLLSACGGGGDPKGTPSVTASPTAQESPKPEVSLDEHVELPDQGLSVYVKCYGEGAPTTILEAGSADAGTQAFIPLFLQSLAAEGGTVCTYDRIGTGLGNPPPPGKKRLLRDQVNELHAMLTATGLPTPYVLAGSSWGGFVVMDYAAVYPDDVGALVLLDVPAPSAELTEDDFGGPGYWNNPAENPELVDAVEAENRLANEPPQIPPVHLRVVTATDGQSSVENQSFWMELSPESVSVELEGAHDIHQDNFDGVIDEILEAIHSAG